MSKTCGDMARYNRLRKHKIRKRAQMATLRTEVQAQRPPQSLRLLSPKLNST